MFVSMPSIAGFVLGALAVLAVEAIVIVYVIRRLTQSTTRSVDSSSVSAAQHRLDPGQSLHSVYQKQGVVWILEPEKIPQISASVDHTSKREILEVTPVRKHAKIKDRTLLLTEADGSLTKIVLKGCQVAAVSATSLPSRKWAKRYPIKLESKTAALHRGSKVLYIYAETCWEKESWCKALRVASSDDKERLLWFSKLNEEFRSYLRSLTEGYPSLIKPSVGYHGGPLDKVSRLDDPPSKVRQLWKKLSKKAPSSSHDEKRIAERSNVLQNPGSVSSVKKTAMSGRMSNASVEDSSSVSSAAFSRSGSSSHISEISDADGSQKCIIDEGTLCWNLIISRLFFDAKDNADIKNSLKARIQRTLSNMRTPSYLGEVTCTDVDLGSLPPYIQGMRAVPTDMNDLWALEMDIEYCGGVVLYIEARLEVGELDVHNAMLEPNNESSSGKVTPDLLEDFKHLQDELKLSDGIIDSTERKDGGDTKLDKLRSSRTGLSIAGSGSRWKSILNSVAKHVSQVPLTLAIRVESLKGTIQLHINPPPSDQLWFGFTSMPEINFQLESSVKDHKISSGRIASFLINRFKASIRETLVLPNCESACVPWMLAEKDDWLPRNAAPFIWLSREAPSFDATTSSTEGSHSHSGGRVRKTGEQDQESKQVKQKNVDSVKQKPKHEDGGEVASPLTPVKSTSDTSSLSDDLRAPLLENGEARELSIVQKKEENNPECDSPSRYISLKEQQRNSFGEDDDGKQKRVGRRAKMFDLGKKMGEKFEEKKRSFEEKGRNIVEKMRGP